MTSIEKIFIAIKEVHVYSLQMAIDSVQRLRLFAVGFMNLFQVTDPC